MQTVVSTAAVAAEAAVILNAKSGSGACGAHADRVAHAFRASGWRVRMLCPDAGEEVRDLVRASIEAQPAVVVAAGGDGTVSAVADVLRGTGIALGVVPLGTLNHFARDVGIPLDLEEAVRTIVAGHRISVDVGEVNGRGFINNASLGLYPGIVRERTRQQRRLRRSKRAAMLWATLAVLQRPPLLDLRLDLEDATHACWSPFVFVGNNDYVLEGFDIGRRERLDAGFLNVYSTRSTTAGGLVLLALRALAGLLRQAEDFHEATARRLRVASRHASLLVATDGEVQTMRTPLEFRIQPRALHVMVPAEPRR